MKENKGPLNDCVEIRVTKCPGNIYDIYLHNCIVEPHHYTDFLSILHHCTEDDFVNLHINSGGGHLNTAMQIINAIRQCKALVTTIIECEAHSAASLIFLAGKRFIVQPGAAMLCHFYTGSAYGKGHELKSEVDYKDKHYKRQFAQLYANFLNKEEINRLFCGVDYWFEAEEIVARLEGAIKRKKIIKANKKK